MDVTFTPRPPRKTLQFPQNSKLGGPQSWSTHFGENNRLPLSGLELQFPLLSRPPPTHDIHKVIQSPVTPMEE
jgi:hypothetical protein